MYQPYSKIFPTSLYPRDPSNESANLQRCYELLNLTSRSFAAVIQQLHPELRDAVALFYIILRGLDTIEDDMTLSTSVKIPLLRSFYQVLDQDGWTFTDSGPAEKDRLVLVEFDKVIAEFHNLRPEYQKAITETTQKMGNGMADYAIDEQFNRDGLDTVADYDLYCYYVAGLVGDGLTRLAIMSKFGNPVLAENADLHRSMGLFLQKTNIIRDFREDFDANRSFYPKELWAKHVSSLKDLVVIDVSSSSSTIAAEKKLQQLNVITDMTINALTHVPHVLEYLDNVSEPSLYRFCAIPQVMAIATLELVFCNPSSTFTSHLKIRRGLFAKLMLQAQTRRGLYLVFREYVQRIHLQNKPSAANYLELEVLCANIEQYIEQHCPKETAMEEKSPDELMVYSREATVRMAVLGGTGAVVGSLAVVVAYFAGIDFSVSLKDIIEGYRTAH